MSLLIIFYILLFILGTVMGSFSGVIIERGRNGFDWKELPKILGGRSYCPGCIEKDIGRGSQKISEDEKQQLQRKYTLKWWQLIPLVGWLIQGGKCYRCKSSIPVWYPFYEIIMGFAFVVVAYCIVGGTVENLWGDGGTSALYLLFSLGIVRASVGIIIADFLRYELNVWLWLFLLLRIIGREFSGVLGNIFLSGFTWLFVLTGIFALIYYFGKWYVKKKFGVEGEGFGQGDVMMAMVIGLLFPFVVKDMGRIAGIQLLMLYLIVSSVLGIIFRGLRLLIQKNSESTIPFLPAMMLGFVVLFLWGENFIRLLH